MLGENNIGLLSSELRDNMRFIWNKPENIMVDACIQKGEKAMTIRMDQMVNQISLVSSDFPYSHIIKDKQDR